MKPENKNLKFSKVLFKGTFIYNPVLTQAIGICTIAAIGTTLKISIIYSLLISALIIFMEVFSSLILKKLSRWLRIAAYMLLSTLLLLPVILRIEETASDISAAMGIFLPLLAVNSIIVIRCEIFGVNNKVRNSFFDAVAASIGFTAVSLIIGAVRELMAFGTLFGKAVTKTPVFSGIALPFGGLITIGFLAALHKWIILKKFPRHPTNTFNLRTASDTPVLRNEGIRVTNGSLSFMRDPVPADEDNDKDSTYSEAEKADARKLFMFDDSDDSDISVDEIIGSKKTEDDASPKAEDTGSDDDKKEDEEE